MSDEIEFMDRLELARDMEIKDMIEELKTVKAERDRLMEILNDHRLILTSVRNTTEFHLEQMERMRGRQYPAWYKEA